MTYHICCCHTGHKPYHCPDCTCSFCLEANVNTHCCVHHQVEVASAHCSLRSNSKYYHVCHQVKKSSASQVSGQGHWPVRDSNTSIAINKKYVYKDSRKILTHHYHDNNEEKPYVCGYEDCEKSFSWLSSLTSHARIHNVGKVLLNRIFLPSIIVLTTSIKDLCTRTVKKLYLFSKLSKALLYSH